MHVGNDFECLAEEAMHGLGEVAVRSGSRSPCVGDDTGEIAAARLVDYPLRVEAGRVQSGHAVLRAVKKIIDRQSAFPSNGGLPEFPADGIQVAMNLGRNGFYLVRIIFLETVRRFHERPVFLLNDDDSSIAVDHDEIDFPERRAAIRFRAGPVNAVIDREFGAQASLEALQRGHFAAMGAGTREPGHFGNCVGHNSPFPREASTPF